MTVKTVVKRAARAITNTFSSGDSDVASTDILDTLKKEHDEVKGLLKDLGDAQTPVQRRNLVQRIKVALVPHTKAEEKVVYDAVIALRDKEAQMDGHEGYLEHKWAAKTLQRLEASTNAASPELRAEHHIGEEERKMSGRM